MHGWSKSELKNLASWWSRTQRTAEVTAHKQAGNAEVVQSNLVPSSSRSTGNEANKRGVSPKWIIVGKSSIASFLRLKLETVLSTPPR